MSRNRVRRSFTVETKARGRQAPASLPVRAPLIEQPSPAFPSLEAAALFGGKPAPRTETEQVERAAPRRILPSLIEAPAAEAERAEPPAREPRLPRVRRVKLPRAEAQGETAGAGRARPERAASPAVRAEPAPVKLAQPLPEQVEPAQAKLPRANAAEPVRRTVRRSEKPLRLGERWKRRLPRVCW